MQAAAVQAASANRAADLQMQMYQQGVAREQPWVSAGGAALNQLGGLYGLPGYTAQDPTATLVATPGYQWGLSQGVNARDLSAASRGLALSGAQQKGLTAYGQNYGLQNAWNPYINQLNTMSGQGQSGAALQAGQGLDTGKIMGQDYMSAGAAQAQGIYNAYLANRASNQGWLGALGAGLSLATAPMTGGTSLIGAGMSGLGSLFGGGGGGGWANPAAYNFSPSSWGGDIGLNY